MPKPRFFAMDIFRQKRGRFLITVLLLGRVFHVKHVFALYVSVSRETSSTFCLVGKHWQK
ncbi:MAG: hypothetical protein RI953_2875 [Pseudomonadota bacterium]|jgi:hypothetical protein